MKKERLMATTLIMIAVLFLPYWIYVPMIGAAMILFPLYSEAVIFGFVIDALYGTSPFKLALIFALCLTLLLPVRERLRFSF